MAAATPTPLARKVFYTATFVVLAISVRACLGRPPSLGFALIVSLIYFGLILIGVLSLRLRVFADAVTCGPSNARGVALTFDDGPHPIFTRKVLDILDAAGARATFFVIARKAEENPELVREIIARGHGIGLHSYAHDRLFALRAPRRVRADLKRGMDVLEKITGARAELFRPPIGHTNPGIARVADELDLAIIGWSVSGRDGLASAKPARVVSRVRSALVHGAIILLHDAPELGDYEPAGVRALPAILEAIGKAKLEVVPLDPWV